MSAQHTPSEAPDRVDVAEARTAALQLMFAELAARWAMTQPNPAREIDAILSPIETYAAALSQAGGGEHAQAEAMLDAVEVVKALLERRMNESR